MDYIDVEEFLKQSKKIQETLAHFHCEYHKTPNAKTIPIMSETELRKFIEEKTGGKVDCAYYNFSKGKFNGYTIGIWIDNPYKCIKEFKDLGKDLLQAYWQVACKIAAEDI